MMGSESKIDSVSSSGDEDGSDDDSEETESGDDEEDEDSSSSSDNSDEQVKANIEGQKSVTDAGDDEDTAQSTIEDRVFVCIGKYKDSSRQAVWVMTLDPGFEE